MDTEKAIEIMKRIYYCDKAGKIKPDDIEKVFECLEEGEKYKEMWEELYVIHGNTIVDDIASLSNVMEILEQRYFPNSINKINQLLMELDVLIHETLGLLGG